MNFLHFCLFYMHCVPPLNNNCILYRYYVRLNVYSPVNRFFRCGNIEFNCTYCDDVASSDPLRHKNLLFLFCIFIGLYDVVVYTDSENRFSLGSGERSDIFRLEKSERWSSTKSESLTLGSSALASGGLCFSFRSTLNETEIKVEWDHQFPALFLTRFNTRPPVVYSE